MQVKCITLNPFPGDFAGGCEVEIGGIYNVVDTENRRGFIYYELAEHLGTCYASEMFEVVEPYSNSVSKELAEKAMNVGDGADQPVKIKELETSN